MAIWQLTGPRGTDRPVALVRASDGWRHPCSGAISELEEIPLDTFTVDQPDPAGTESAVARFRAVVRDGLKPPGSNGQHHDDGWRFRGSPAYLDKQAPRLGLALVLTHRARHNPEIHRASALLGQLCERYHKMRRLPDGTVWLQGSDRAQVAATLEQAFEESAKLHALAAATLAMIDEGYAAFGIDAPARHFRVSCDFDEATSPSYGDTVPIRRVRDRAQAREKAAAE